MANIDAAFGLKPIRHLNGNPWNGATRKYLKEDALNQALFMGDPIVMTGTAASDDPTGIYPAITIATAGTTNPCHGVITSFDPVDAAGVWHDTVYSPAKESRYVNVCIDPDVIFIIQDDASATLTGDDIGGNADYASGTGSNSTGLSGWELNATSISTTPADNLLIMRVYPLERELGSGNALGNWCIWEVLISHHGFRCQTGMTGV